MLSSLVFLFGLFPVWGRSGQVGLSSSFLDVREKAKGNLMASVKFMETVKASSSDKAWKSQTARVTRQVKHEGGVCRGLVSAQYLSDEAMENADAILMLYEGTGSLEAKSAALRLRLKRNGLKAFAVLQHTKEGVYVDVICAQKGFGAEMMRRVETYTCDHDLGGQMSLSSLTHVITLYRYFGFHHGKTCKEDPEVSAVASAVRHLKFPSGQAALESPDFCRLLKTLVPKKLVTKKACSDISFDETTGCAVDGYPMTKCLTCAS
uniref:Uncharacterized protein n=1 Tax=Chromera velia CCMP2878 TaxID=1169474 RepID=A0A0G4FMQ1_9ALVE|eukprot:Cvel_17835.t1-p1 / transcript=Cvel_17835.t1 / gene=Cvel_17835 / organism=Chromera_velia_CCMP2878 / gene_product=hypothetical protein / transcript_product=hypothetical protein / location=Cvel_scaffold1446:4856-6489(-) / protein_length=263 / sequence_SO=supercontig / SO=protein_coding / is_pseudo=false